MKSDVELAKALREAVELMNQAVLEAIAAGLRVDASFQYSDTKVTITRITRSL